MKKLSVVLDETEAENVDVPAFEGDSHCPITHLH
jgi:hypothetical protein